MITNQYAAKAVERFNRSMEIIRDRYRAHGSHSPLKAQAQMEQKKSELRDSLKEALKGGTYITLPKESWPAGKHPWVARVTKPGKGGYDFLPRPCPCGAGLLAYLDQPGNYRAGAVRFRVVRIGDSLQVLQTPMRSVAAA